MLATLPMLEIYKSESGTFTVRYADGSLKDFTYRELYEARGTMTAAENIAFVYAMGWPMKWIAV